VRAEVPHPRRGRARGRGDRPVPRARRAAPGADGGRGRGAQRACDGPPDAAEGAVLMLHTTVTPSEKRQAFRAGLNSGTIQRFPGAFTPLSARLIQEKGFEGVYISGAVMANELGHPDIGLTTLSEV